MSCHETFNIFVVFLNHHHSCFGNQITHHIVLNNGGWPKSVPTWFQCPGLDKRRIISVPKHPQTYPAPQTPPLCVK